MIGNAVRLCLVALLSLLFPACQTAPSAGQSSAPDEEDIRNCEDLTRRILETRNDDLAFIRATYASPLRDELLRAVTADPYDGGLDYDYVYDTQDDMPVSMTVGPGRISGLQIVVPVDMRYRHIPAREQSWIFIPSGDRWAAADIVYSNGRKLTGELK